MSQHKSNRFFADIFRKLVGGLGWLGVFFIAYSLIAEKTGESWTFIEIWGPPLSIFFTIVSTLLTTGSVYFYDNQYNPPEKFSLYISAPLVIIACCLALWLLFKTGSLPLMLTNGFAILGLSGGLFRIQNNPGLVR